MGWVNYVVSPKLKLMFVISRNVEAVPEVEIPDEFVDTWDWTVRNLPDQKIADVGAVIEFYRKFADDYFFIKVFMIGLRQYDPDIYIVCELGDDACRLKEAGYKVVEMG